MRTQICSSDCILHSIAKTKPVTSPDVRQHRIRWARVVENWTVQQNWCYVIFIDEFCITLSKCDGRTIVWCTNKERYIPECLQVGRAGNQAGCMFWGCIGIGGIGHLVDIPGNFNAVGYINILQNHLRASAQQTFRNPQQPFVFQQDNATPHSAIVTTA